MKVNKFQLVLVSFLSILMSSCSTNHTHDFNDWKYLNETYHMHECSCGTRVLEEHAFLDHVLLEPTHTKTGVVEHTCSICGYSYKSDIEKLPEHTFNVKNVSEEYKVHDATCTHKAEYYYSCECGAKGTETFFSGECKEHEFEEISRTEPTFTKNGEIMYKCKHCEATKTESINRLGILEKEKKILQTKSVKILTIGNSLTDDVCHNLHEILHNMGITKVVIGKMWVGGTGIDYHATHMEDNASVYTFDYYDEVHGWVSDPVKRNLEYAFSKEKWDFISLSTVGPIVEPQYAATSITKAIDYVMKNGNDAIPLWYIPGISRESYFNQGGHNECGYTHAQALNDAKQLIKDRVQCHEEIQAIVPSLASTEMLINTYGFDIFHRDDVHYSYPIGTVVTGLTFAKTILPSFNLTNFTFDGIARELLEDIKKAVEIAQEKPFYYNGLDSEGDEKINGYLTSCGSFKNITNGFKSLSKNSLLLKEDSTFSVGSIEFKTIPLTANFNGAIYCVDSSTDYFWEAGANYYFAGISSVGEAFLSRVLCKSGSVWDCVDSVAIKNFDPTNTYSVKVLYKNGQTALYINNELMINYLDKSAIAGNRYGFRIESRGTSIFDINVTNNPDIILPEIIEPKEIDGYTFRSGNYIEVTNGFKANKNNSIIEYNESFEKGVVKYKFKSVNGGESGFIFGLSNPTGLTNYWETNVSYYMSAITSNGGCAFGAVNYNGNPWIWLTDPNKSFINNFDKDKEYEVQVIWDSENSQLQMLVDNVVMASYDDEHPLTGTICGFRSGKSGNTYTNISYSSKIPPKDGSYVDTVAGWDSKYDEVNDYFVYTNKTNNATRIYKDKTISSSTKKQGTITFNYRNKGLEYDATSGKPRSNWCAGIMFATSLDVKAQNGQFVVFGKTSGAPRRIASMLNNGTSQSWNLALASSQDIVVNDDEVISLKIDYDFDAGTFAVTGNGKTSTFPMPNIIKEAGTLYIGLYGSRATNSYPYGELTISNLIIS